MGSVRRLARLLASHVHAQEDVSRQPRHAPPRACGGEAPVAARLPLVVQKGGFDCGGLARVDSLGLVVRIKHNDEGACPLA